MREPWKQQKNNNKITGRLMAIEPDEVEETSEHQIEREGGEISRFILTTYFMDGCFRCHDDRGINKQ